MMKKGFFFALIIAGFCFKAYAQKILFTEFDLDNGLHVILHKDNSAPVVAVSVMYLVGSKDDESERTGFAHFFEHLLFEGSENIKRDEFLKLVGNNGGKGNANTNRDRTFYYEVFPSNQLELGLWLESERMLHPIIDEVGVKIQNEVVKEEKRSSVDNVEYGRCSEEIYKRLFKGHPYCWNPIGTMKHLDAAKLSEFIAFFKKYYIPNNAVLTIAGDLDLEKTKDLVKSYFAEVPKGTPIVRKTYQATEITKEIIDTAYDANIDIPAILVAYRIPGMKSRENKVLRIVEYILSGGRGARLNTKIVDKKENALKIRAIKQDFEDYGAYIIFATPRHYVSLNNLLKDIDEEILRLQTHLISEKEYIKLQNQFETFGVSTNSKMIDIAENLSDGYTFYDKDTNNLNKKLDVIRSITREEIREVAKKYLVKNQRVVLYYLPQK